MPSHITHLLFAEDTCSRAGLAVMTEPSQRSSLVLGAQGPDIFYHNQRRKPSGLTYGPLMHRHGYGTAVAHMTRRARQLGLPPESWAGAWIVGFATHAILDRYTHPYINYFSGWVEPGDPHTEQFRSMHPFLERLIDVTLLQRTRGIHPNDLGFFDIVNCGPEPPRPWLDLMIAALSGAYQRAARDSDLASRLTSAYLDTMGYYHFTNFVDGGHLAEALGREERGEIGTRWLSIVHPPNVPDDVDVLNLRGTVWRHPCSSREERTESLLDLYEAALEESVRTVRVIMDAWRVAAGPGAAGPAAAEPNADFSSAVEHAVANWNLSDGRPAERACRKKYAAPLPLGELQARIRASIRGGGGGRL